MFKLAIVSMTLSLGFSPVLAGEGCAGHGEAKAGSEVRKNAITAENGKASYRERFPEIRRKALLAALEAKSVFLVDANGSESYSQGHIPGAVSFASMDAEKFSAMLPENKDALIVAYCGGPGCQAWCKAADKLEELGYTNIRHFKGGIKEWKTAGLAVAKPAENG